MKTGWVLLLVSTLLCGACAAVLYGVRPRDHLKMSHEKHKAAQVDCVMCHEDMASAKTLKDSTLPSEERCMVCHSDKKDQGRCDFCHSDVQQARHYAPRTHAVSFSHEAHLGKVNDDCTTCHARPSEPGQSVQHPSMAVCLGCHEHKKEYDEGRCVPCHLDMKRLDLKPVTTFSHRGNFVRTHGAVARSSAEACATCHDQTFCADCHAGTVSTPIEVKYPERVESGFIHRNDFLGRHSIEARGEPASCRRCHGTSFCESCHRMQNLSPAGVNPRDPHPVGWSMPGSPSFHGTEARRDITVCASCHDQGASSTCVQCHRVGGMGGNPHPPGWSSKHGRGEITSNSMCQICHQ